MAIYLQTEYLSDKDGGTFSSEVRGFSVDLKKNKSFTIEMVDETNGRSFPERSSEFALNFFLACCIGQNGGDFTLVHKNRGKKDDELILIVRDPNSKYCPRPMPIDKIGPDGIHSLLNDYGCFLPGILIPYATARSSSLSGPNHP